MEYLALEMVFKATGLGVPSRGGVWLKKVRGLKDLHVIPKRISNSYKLEAKEDLVEEDQWEQPECQEMKRVV